MNVGVGWPVPERFVVAGEPDFGPDLARVDGLVFRLQSDEVGTQASPLIESSAWGSVRASGSDFRDVKLFPGGLRAWDWTETGTAHRPGVGPGDVEELVEKGARTVILSTGRAGRLRVPDATVGYLEARGVEVEVMGTDDAVRRYNDLAGQGAPVGALIHTTC